MTELEWNQCIDPLRMLEDLPTFVRCGKLILFAAACCRRLGKDLRHPSIWRLLEAAERFAQGRLPVESFQEHIVLATAEHSAGNNQRKGRGHPDRSGLAAIGLLTPA